MVQDNYPWAITTDQRLSLGNNYQATLVRHFDPPTQWDVIIFIPISDAANFMQTLLMYICMFVLCVYQSLESRFNGCR